MIEAISPKEKDSRPNGQLVDECISYLNDCIKSRQWHDNFCDPKVLIENYYAIIIRPSGRFNDTILDEAVKAFNKKGWDSTHGECYDGRGPHHCFYVSKKSFN